MIPGINLEAIPAEERTPVLEEILAGRDGIGNRFSQIVRYTADAATGYRTLVPDSRVVLVGAG